MNKTTKIAWIRTDFIVYDKHSYDVFLGTRLFHMYNFFTMQLPVADYSKNDACDHHRLPGKYMQFIW